MVNKRSSGKPQWGSLCNSTPIPNRTKYSWQQLHPHKQPLQTVTSVFTTVVNLCTPVVILHLLPPKPSAHPGWKPGDEYTGLRAGSMTQGRKMIIMHGGVTLKEWALFVQWQMQGQLSRIYLHPPCIMVTKKKGELNKNNNSACRADVIVIGANVASPVKL